MADHVGDAVEDPREHLAIGEFAMPNSRTMKTLLRADKLDKLKGGEGIAFSVDQDDEDFDIFNDDDECDGVYDDETYAIFDSYTPADRKMKMNLWVHDDADADEDQDGTDHFDEYQQVPINLSEQEALMKNVNADGTLKKMVVKEGNGTKVPEVCLVFYHYTAIAEGTSVPYDSTFIKGLPNVMDMRDSGNLVGLVQAIQSMEMREASRFIVDPSLGFGTFGCPPRVGPNKRLLFIIETLQFIDESRLNTPLYMSIEKRNDLHFERIYECSSDLHKKGNGHHSNGSYQRAINKWRKAISLLEEYSMVTMETDLMRRKLLHTLYSNTAQAYLNLKKYPQAIMACKWGLKMVDGQDQCKLYYRFAKAKLNLFDEEGALRLVKQGLQCNPDHPELLKLKKQIHDQVATAKEEQKKLYQRMLNPDVKP